MREKAEYDYYAGLAKATEKGRAEGRAEGRVEGEANIINKLKEMGMYDEYVAKLEKGDYK